MTAAPAHLGWRGHAFRWVWASQGSARLVAVLALAAAVGAVLQHLLHPSPSHEARQAQAAGNEALERQLDGLRTRLAQLAAAPPPSAAALHPAEDGGSWRWHTAALAAGLRVDRLRPVPAEGAQPARLELRLRGRYPQHGAFVADLARQALPFRLLSYRLQASPDGLHAADLLLALPPALVSLPGADMPAPDFADASDPFAARVQPADPFADLPPPWREELQRPRGVLESAALSAFELTGTLERAGAWVGLLRGQGLVHSVGPGDYLGPQLARVLRVDEQGVWLRELVRDAEGRWSARERLWRVGDGP